MATREEVLRILAVTAAAYPNFNLQEETIRVYTRLLADIPVEALEAGALQHVSASKFFPTVAELRDCAFAIVAGEDRVPSAYEAWGMVQAEIRRIGSYSRPDFGQTAIQRAVEIMGWRELCLSDQPEYDRAHFFRVYDSLVSRQRADTRLLPSVRQAIQSAADRLSLTEGRR